MSFALCLFIDYFMKLETNASIYDDEVLTFDCASQQQY